MGTAFAAASPVKTFADTLYIEAWLKPGQKLTLPDAEERGLYVAKGKLRAGGTEVPEYSMAVLAAHEGVTVEAIEDTRIALVGETASAAGCVDDPAELVVVGHGVVVEHFVPQLRDG